MANLTNVSALCNLSKCINLQNILVSLSEEIYRPQRFSGCIWKFNNPKATVLLFRTGKFMIVGVKSLIDAHTVSQTVVEKLSSIGEQVDLISFKITNLVSSDSLNFEINLQEFASTHSYSVQWEPELFPALIYRDSLRKITALIFYQGKIILTGAHCELDLDQCFYKLVDLLKQFKR